MGYTLKAAEVKANSRQQEQDCLLSLSWPDAAAAAAAERWLEDAILVATDHQKRQNTCLTISLDQWLSETKAIQGDI